MPSVHARPDPASPRPQQPELPRKRAQSNNTPSVPSEGSPRPRLRSNSLSMCLPRLDEPLADALLSITAVFFSFFFYVFISAYLQKKKKLKVLVEVCSVHCKRHHMVLSGFGGQGSGSFLFSIKMTIETSPQAQLGICSMQAPPLHPSVYLSIVYL